MQSLSVVHCRGCLSSGRSVHAVKKRRRKGMRCFILRLSCFERIKGLSFELDVDVSYSEMVDMEKVEGFNELIDEKLFEEPCCEVSS